MSGLACTWGNRWCSRKCDMAALTATTGARRATPGLSADFGARAPRPRKRCRLVSTHTASRRPERADALAYDFGEECSILGQDSSATRGRPRLRSQRRISGAVSALRAAVVAPTAKMYPSISPRPRPDRSMIRPVSAATSPIPSIGPTSRETQARRCPGSRRLCIKGNTATAIAAMHTVQQPAAPAGPKTGVAAHGRNDE